ncbi:MAG: 6-phosphofructokinase [Bacteroidota bacterium]
MQKSVAILCAGGPAPGINTVVSTVSKVFLKDGFKVIGLHDGYKNLFNGTAEYVDIDFEFADRIFNKGGSALRMSRHKPKDDEFRPEFFEENNVKLLVTVGGDDTASTANRIAKFLTNNNLSIQNIHVPKTIDNDLPLPEGMPTFGFNSAKNEGVRIGNTVYEDARTSGNWFVVSAMGRSAGHLAFEIAASCHFPVIVIPEMFANTEITIDRIVKVIVSSMIARKLDGVDYGVAMVSEGVFHSLSDDEINNCGVNFTYDDHGHPELGNVSKAHIFNMLVQRELKKIGLSIKSRPVELGYEVRCSDPVAFDLTYCTLLGLGVNKLYHQGVSGAIVSTTPRNDIRPVFLSDIEDKTTGKIPPRLVDIDGPLAQIFLHDLHVLCEPDYEVAKEIVDKPEEYDFYKILNWEFDPKTARPAKQ